MPCTQAYISYVVRPRPVDVKQQSEDLADHLAANLKPEPWADAALRRCPGINQLCAPCMSYIIYIYIYMHIYIYIYISLCALQA